MIKQFELVAGERMDFIKANISGYNVHKEVNELMAMLELMAYVSTDYQAIMDLVQVRTGFTIKQLSNYAMSAVA